MANVKVVADKQTDNLTDGQTDKTKTISPQSIDAGHKKVRTRTYKHTVKPVLETTCIKQPPDLTLSQTSPGFYVSAVQVF